MAPDEPARTDERKREYIWAPRALLPDGWAANVVMESNAEGYWQAVKSDVPFVEAQRRGATCLSGALLPGLVNAHSHAFQRAFAGFAERRETAMDDFWSWRASMYRVALLVSPAQVRAIATQLYIELLCGGYTHVCEFHYLQHAPDGSGYEDPLEIAYQLRAAAVDAGIGITLLPVLYERAGFEEPLLKADQLRFAADARFVIDARRRQEGKGGSSMFRSGIAIHSLRAASPKSIDDLVHGMADIEAPIHMHVAEQTGEVEACVKATGKRPLEWLLSRGLLDERWHLVHATHATDAEINGLGSTGAGVVLCPTTEANLGDGLCDLRGFLASPTPLSVGSDSHVTRDWREELRVLEYGQRLTRRSRNVSASPEEGVPSTAERLLRRFIAGGAVAAGFSSWGLVEGARADLVHADLADSATIGVPTDRLLDAMVFSSPALPFRDVMAGGRWVVRAGLHDNAPMASQRFEEVMGALWGS